MPSRPSTPACAYTQAQYRLRTAHDEGVQERFFLGFAALALRAELETRMRAAHLHKTLTDANVRDELGKAKALATRKGARILLEVSKKRRELFAALKVPELAWLSYPRDFRR